MRVCKHCGAELERFDQHGNEGWHCPNDCAFLKACEQLEQEEGAKSHAQLQAEQEDMMAIEAIMEQTHCWNCQAHITRTPESRDWPFGNFCPKCGESLRNYYHRGEGHPGSLAKRG